MDFNFTLQQEKFREELREFLTAEVPVEKQEIFGLLTEEQYRKAVEDYGPRFRAQMGAEAIKELLKRADIEELAEEMRDRMRTETSVQKKLKYTE